MKLFVEKVDKAWRISEEQIKKHKIQVGAISPMLGKRIITDEAGHVTVQDIDMCEIKE